MSMMTSAVRAGSIAIGSGSASTVLVRMRPLVRGLSTLTHLARRLRAMRLLQDPNQCGALADPNRRTPFDINALCGRDHRAETKERRPHAGKSAPFQCARAMLVHEASAMPRTG